MPDELNQISLLAPHISRAVTLHTLNERARCKGMLEGLEALHCAGFLVDGKGQVSQTNRSAQALLGHGLTIVDGHLTATHQDDTRDLAALVHSVAVETSERDVAPGCVLLRRENKQPLIARVIPLRRDAQALFSKALAIVLVTAPEHRTQTSAALIGKAFRLTASEARVAACLADGKAVSEISDELGYTIGTLRQLIKQVFAKTGTHRQSELSSLIQSYLR